MARSVYSLESWIRLGPRHCKKRKEAASFLKVAPFDFFNYNSIIRKYVTFFFPPNNQNWTPAQPHENARSLTIRDRDAGLLMIYKVCSSWSRSRFFCNTAGARRGNSTLTLRRNVLPLSSTVSKDLLTAGGGGRVVFQNNESLSYAATKPHNSHNALLRRCLALFHAQRTSFSAPMHFRGWNLTISQSVYSEQ
jgi:hypothetical protein